MIDLNYQVPIQEQSPLNLAFVGDSVLELLVRRRLAAHSRLPVGKLNSIKVGIVSAHGQYAAVQEIEPLLTEQEKAVLHRGRNASKATVSKHATVEEYRSSTGLEALLGWLYLQGENRRIEELFQHIWAAQNL